MKNAMMGCFAAALPKMVEQIDLKTWEGVAVACTAMACSAACFVAKAIKGEPARS